jgi:uncharacterized membrane protein YciS (DUF1049 family)
VQVIFFPLQGIKLLTSKEENYVHERSSHSLSTKQRCLFILDMQLRWPLLNVLALHLSLRSLFVPVMLPPACAMWHTRFKIPVIAISKDIKKEKHRKVENNVEVLSLQPLK